MNMKNVVFDLGGVVVDWNPQRLLQEYPGDKALPVSLFERGFFQEYWVDFDRGTVSQEKMVEEMSDFARRPFQECWEFVEYIKHSLSDIPQTVSLIERLSVEGYNLYCLSNMSIEFYDYLKVRDVFTYFNGQIISALEKLVKPEPEIYMRLVERYHIKPEETLFIDDLSKNTEAAEKLGFHTVLFADRERGYEQIEKLLGI